MEQTRLCKYLGLTCKHPDTFLRLPVSVRERIYLHAGLITNSSIVFVFGRVGQNHVAIADDDYDFTFNILQVCRMVYAEVQGILLSRNTLILTHDNIDEGLLYLGDLSPSACSQLRNVYVHLHVTEPRFPGETTPPLKWEDIETWQWAATHILSHASPRQLRLHLICDTGDTGKTSAVLQPLYNFPGVLLELELRTHAIHDRRLHDLAREAVRRIEAKAEIPQPPFRFLDLPAEIRYHIYTYTDLVTPFQHAQWSPEEGFNIEYPFCECDGSICREPDLHHARSFCHCGAISLLEGSFCTRYHSAHSSRCNHKFRPRSLMLVSRAVYREAVAFFFSRNQITILPSTSYADSLNSYEGMPLRPLPKQDGVTKFFLERRMSPEVLYHIRTLELVLPQIDPESSLLDQSSSDYKEWCLAVDYLAAHANLPKLTLIVHLCTTRRHNNFASYMLGATATDSDIVTSFEAQSRILAPLSRLSHVKRLFVHLEWPGHWSPPKLLDDISKRPYKESPGCGIGDLYIPRRREHVAEREVRLEKMIMGATYDSDSLGKGDQFPSPPLRVVWL